VTWRARLRKSVNREEHLGPVRRGLLRIIDPIEWYMRKSDEDAQQPRSQRRGSVGGTAYAPLEPVSAAEAEALVINAAPTMRTAGEPAEDMDAYARRHDYVRLQHTAYFEERARDLLAGKEAVIETTQGTVRARLVRFRNGAVFEHWEVSGHSTGHGMTRLDRTDLSDPVAVLVNYLVFAVIDLE
jgi:hypothetical protein